ncbi:MAG TPA: LysR family transcriptional regulator [Alphaproteobacteria bacterium]|nr:LysR family transcriptional regulator [Alphaproteobacteria bacterium]
MDQLAAMRAFVRVVEAGSFTRAAISLDTPKPTVTKLIQTLEQHLRTKLLNRTTRRVTVTSDGAAYYERAVQLIADIDELDGSMAAAQTRPKGKLRIDMSGAVAQLVILPALPKFFEAYPDIQIDLGVSDRVTDLIGENVDCVLRVGELLDQSLIARKLSDMPMITCAAPSYLARMGEPNHPDDLETGHQMVNFFSQRTGRIVCLDFVRGNEHLEIEGQHKVTLNEGTSYVSALVAGLGIGQSPKFMVDHYLATGQLKPVLPDWTVPPLPLHVVYPPNRHLSNKLRVFVDWVAGLFAGGAVPVIEGRT